MKKNDIMVFLFLFLFFYPFLTTHASSLREDAVVKAVRETSPAVVNISTEQVVERKVSPFYLPFSMILILINFLRIFLNQGMKKNIPRKAWALGLFLKREVTS